MFLSLLTLNTEEVSWYDDTSNCVLSALFGIAWIWDRSCCVLSLNDIYTALFRCETDRVSNNTSTFSSSDTLETFKPIMTIEVVVVLVQLQYGVVYSCDFFCYSFVLLLFCIFKPFPTRIELSPFSPLHVWLPFRIQNGGWGTAPGA